ncbi:hypothetical protein KKC32_01620 [Patescibacteria group bacterium]|nr:hypothetical protein [Patescibacteria group bacterium]
MKTPHTHLEYPFLRKKEYFQKVTKTNEDGVSRQRRNFFINMMVINALYVLLIFVSYHLVISGNMDIQFFYGEIIAMSFILGILFIYETIGLKKRKTDEKFHLDWNLRNLVDKYNNLVARASTADDSRRMLLESDRCIETAARLCHDIAYLTGKKNREDEVKAMMGTYCSALADAEEFFRKAEAANL